MIKIFRWLNNCIGFTTRTLCRGLFYLTLIWLILNILLILITLIIIYRIFSFVGNTCGVSYNCFVLIFIFRIWNQIDCELFRFLSEGIWRTDWTCCCFVIIFLSEVGIIYQIKTKNSFIDKKWRIKRSSFCSILKIWLICNIT